MTPTQGAAENSANPYPVTNPRHIPAARYFDPAFHALEEEWLWPFVWQMACRLEEIPEIGDWVEYQILDKSLIIVRTASGVKAFHNACRHRGMKLVSGQGNCALKGMTCPFHGWRWNMDGENIFVYGRERFDADDLEAAELALVPCRVETWGGCAFVNFDDDAMPLIDGLGPAAERMDARAAGALKAEWWKSVILPVNWKLAMEAFMEGYHVMATHPQLHLHSTPESKMYGEAEPGGEFPPPRSATARDFVNVSIDHLAKLSAGMKGMVHADEVAIAETLRDMDLPDDVAQAPAAFYGRLNHEIMTQGRARGLDVPDLNAAMAKYVLKGVEFFFPHYFLLPLFSAMVAYRVRPLGPETCLFEVWSLAHLPDDPSREPPPTPVPSALDDPDLPEITRQDFSNLPLQQLGIHAKGFEFMRLSPQVEGMISNYHRLIDGYIAGRDRDVLARAAGLACGGLDSPIVDIGF